MNRKRITSIILASTLSLSTASAVMAETTTNNTSNTSTAAMQTPPAKPSGEQPSGEQPPAMPNGEQPSGEQPPAMPNGEQPNGMSAPPGGFGGSHEVTQGTAANEITEDGEYSGNTYTSTGDDENALRVTGANATLSDITVNKSEGKSSNTEDGDFYGQNAALLATDGANVTIKNATVTSSAQNGNGVFSYGEGTVVNISDSKITTTSDNSGGIQTTGGGTTYASNLTVNTSGSSSAAIRSDRGGGTVVVNGGSYTSNGYNSPAVYSTADIKVSDATLTANNSEALVIEGKNSIQLENCDVYGNMSDTKGSSSDENVHNVMIYQSMSGDAEVGTSTFKMSGGKLTSNNGDLFYVTNTHSVIELDNVEINNLESDGALFRISGNSAKRGWGNAGSNGAQVELTAKEQKLDGDIVVDSISKLDLTLAKGSTLTGTINVVDNAQGGTAVDNNAVVKLESGAVWNLTGDCTITSLDNAGTINFNGHKITLADGTVIDENGTTTAEYSKTVKVAIGNNTIDINGVGTSMDAAAYIQSESSSTLVPLRFVSLAVIGSDVTDADTASNVVWDAATKTATITTGDKTISFTAGSNEMTVDGKTTTMDNGVKAEIKDGRLYIPFRAMGKALGVDVAWDADTKTAIYKIK
jgi:hypothetical protein